MHCKFLVDLIIKEYTDLVKIVTKHGEGSIIDQSVYTKNWHFRLYKSTKLGDVRPFRVSSIDMSRLSFEIFSENDVDMDFFDNSLIGNVAENKDPIMVFNNSNKKQRGWLFWRLWSN